MIDKPTDLGGERESMEKEIPEYDLRGWLNAIRREIDELSKTKERVVVAIAGASASGKGEAASALSRELKLAGKRVLNISVDEYYRGITEMVLSQLPAILGDLDLEWSKIYMKNLTGGKKFNEKFSEENIAKIAEVIVRQNPDCKLETIVEALKTAINNLDFDSQEALKLSEAARAIGKLQAGETAFIPTYSMAVSEPVSEERKDGRDYDVIIVEGIFGLSDTLAQTADIRSFVDTDRDTLLLRRLRRDIINSRTSFSPERNLWQNLEIVLPAYEREIRPTRSNADLILRNDYTEVEDFEAAEYDVQSKIALTDKEADNILVALPEAVENLLQDDVYFGYEEGGQSYGQILRLRLENGTIKDLVHKGRRIEQADGKVLRSSETFIKAGEFGEYFQDGELLAKKFKDAGLTMIGRIQKERLNFDVAGIDISIDKIAGLGNFIEFRSNNKLSNIEEIEEIKTRLGLSGRQTAGPYIDEYLKKISVDETKIAEQEASLNRQATRERLVADKTCELLPRSEETDQAFAVLRRGYPEKSLSSQAKGAEFRESAGIITDAIASHLSSQIDKAKAVVLMPWRSGLAFAESFKREGIDSFYHLSAKRDEETLKTIVDYEQGTVGADSIVVIADPMLATGNTILDSIDRMKGKGVLEENIIVCSVVAAPIGVAKIKEAYPKAKILVGSLDLKLDHRGYIVPGLGDFGDKYFADFDSQSLRGFVAGLELPDEARAKVVERIRRQGVSEVLNKLIERDLLDKEIERRNYEKLGESELEKEESKKSLRLDTSRIQGVENVTKAIVNEISDATVILSVEGVSGTGKSSVAEKLAEVLPASKFSLGEVFRYLAYRSLMGEKSTVGELIENLHYEIQDGVLKLYYETENITDTIDEKLRSKAVEERVPIIGALTQAEIIRFVAAELNRLKPELTSKIIIEGRNFTLDYLPSDLRIKLVADPSVRAERRWNQQNENN